MVSIDTFSRDAAKNTALSCLLCFISGFINSLGVFTTFVEASANPPGSLDGVWSAAMALISFCCIPSMFFTGVYLSQCSDPDSNILGVSKTSRARLLSAGGSVCYGLLAIAGYGVAINSVFLVQLAFVPVGVGMGLLYVESMELLAAWVPDRPGLAVGFGQMMFGTGSVVSSSIFSYLANRHTTSNALYFAAAMFFVPTAAATPFLQWPQPRPSLLPKKNEGDTEIHYGTPLSWKQLAYLPSFWMYVTTIFCLQAGQAFVAYYFKIGHTFGEDIPTLVSSFQAATVAGALVRPLVGALVDNLKQREGFFSLGSKNVLLLLLCGQTVSFLGLILVSWKRSFEGFAWLSGTILAIFAASCCCAPLLAREQFGAVNSAIVFGAGGSISLGLGETASILMMASVERSSDNTDVPSGYQAYYFLSLLWSITGLVACVLLEAQEYETVSRSESSESSKTSHLEIVTEETNVGEKSYVTSECGYYGAIDPPLRSVEVS